MKVLAACIVALGLAVSPAFAGTGAASDKDSSGAAASSTAATAANTAGSPTAASKSAESSSTEVQNELQELRDLLETQSKQIQQQNEQLKEQGQQMELLQHQLAETSITADSVAAAVAGPVNPSVGPTTAAVAANKPDSGSNQEPPPPASINIKGISLTPGGFMAAETVWRQKGLASDVNTPFNSVPFDGSSNAHISEFQASGRQSRISMLVEGKLAGVKIGGYYEGDFLSAGTTSTPTESNSYTFRQRQFFAQAAFDNGITFTGGQMWSLVTETTHGMDNRTEALPLTIDAQYNVGFSWARQYGARLTKNFGNKFWLGFSVEDSTPTITVHGNPTTVSGGTAVCVTSACTGSGVTSVNQVTNNNFLLGAFGTSGGLENPLGNYGYNDAPDFVVKAVFEPGFGHYEIFGVAGVVHDRVFPCVAITGTTQQPQCPAGQPTTSALGAFNDSATTGGVGGNARWNLFAKRVDLGIHFLGGAGIGRYGSSTLSDLTVRPDGTVVPIHNFQALGTLQLHPTPKLDIYMNVGGEFEERTDYIKSATLAFGPCVQASTGSGICNEGYGYPSINNSGCWTETLPIAAPGTTSNLGVPTGVAGSTGFIPGALANCTGDTRNIIEGTLGFWYRIYAGSKGRFQYGMQYSNFIRQAWRGIGGTAAGALSETGQPHADENMVFTSFRYYLP
jgi:hypothetical protein